MGPVAAMMEQVAELIQPRVGAWYVVTTTPHVQGRELGSRCQKMKFHSVQPGYWMFVTVPFMGLIPVPVGYIDTIAACDAP